MLQKLKDRVQELEREAEISASRHNGLVGMLMEAKHILKMAEDAVPVAEVVE